MLEKIKEILAEQLSVDAEKVTEETNFVEDLGVDSLDLFELVMALEEEFSIEIPTEATAEMKTVKDVIDYIQSKTA